MEKSIIEKLFLHGESVYQIMLSCSEKKQAVKEIMQKFPEISGSENAVSSNLTQFKTIYPEFSKIQSEKEQLKSENADLKTMLNKVELLYNGIQNSLTEKDSRIIALEKENADLKTMLNKVELLYNGIQNSLTEKDREIIALEKENADLKTMLNKVELSDKLVKTDLKQNENKGISGTENINNADLFLMIQEIKAELNELKQVRKPEKLTDRRTLRRTAKIQVGRWCINKGKDEGWRAYRRINNRVHAVYLGKVYNEGQALELVTAKEKSLGIFEEPKEQQIEIKV